MDVLNMNAFPITPRIKSGSGAIDFAHIAARRRATLPPGFIVDPSWLATQTNVYTYADSESKTVLTLAAATKGQSREPAPIRLTARAPVPTPAPAPASTPSSAPSADSSDATK